MVSKTLAFFERAKTLNTGMPSLSSPIIASRILFNKEDMG
jgi:hypothetical protein